jgi:hypothetical protein
MKLDSLSDENYGIYFDVCRSIRYHDRRRGFFLRMHQTTSVLTILLSGSVLFAWAGAGAPGWLQAMAASTSLLAALDLVVGYSRMAELHNDLKKRFIELEQAMHRGGEDDETWKEHQMTRLGIERDEPPIYRALDLLCYHELCVAEKANDAAPPLNWLQRLTSHFWRWSNIVAVR